MPALTEISAADCRRLLRSTAFGRLALASEAGRTEDVWFRVPWHELTGRRLGPTTTTGPATSGGGA